MRLMLRQKFLLPIAVLILIVLAWQLYQAFICTHIDALQSKASLLTISPAGKVYASAATQQDANSASASLTTPIQTITEMPLSDYEKNYLALVHQYQLLRIHKMILENKIAVVQARVKIARARARLAQYQNSGINLSKQGDGQLTSYQPAWPSLARVEREEKPSGATVAENATQAFESQVSKDAGVTLSNISKLSAIPLTRPTS